MRAEIDLLYKPEKGDTLIFDGKKWVNTSFNHLTYDLQETLKKLSEKIAKLEDEIKIIKGE